MLFFGLTLIVLTFVITYLRRRICARNESPLPKNFVPDFGDSDTKFKRKLTLNKCHERWAKKLEEQREKEKSAEHYEKEMEYRQAKRELERRHPIRKQATYEGAFALLELRRQESQRKYELAKIRKEIFERKNEGGVETKKNPANVAEKQASKTEASELRKRNPTENGNPA